MKAKTTFWDFIDLENYKDNVKGLNYELVSIRYVIDLGQCVECICVVILHTTYSCILPDFIMISG